MTSLSLSWLDSLLQVAFAVLAVRVGRRLPAHVGLQRDTWRMTGLTFVLFSVVVIPQLALGTAAFVLGPEHPLYAAYLRWAPAANHSRTLLVWSLYVSLAVLALHGGTPPPWMRRAYPVLVGTMLVIGGMIGALEGPFDIVRHLSSTSLMDAAAFAALASLLFLLMLRDTIDRALWVALACYGASAVVSSLFLAAIAWINAGIWTPSPVLMEASRVIFTTAMVLMAAWRLRLASRGVPLPGLLGTTRPLQVLT